MARHGSQSPSRGEELRRRKTMNESPSSGDTSKSVPPSISPPPDEEGPGLCSKELVYEVKSRFKKKAKDPPPSAHEVTFSLTIAIAVPCVLDEDIFNGVEGSKKMNYYHIQYKLFPDEKENTKLDLVVYGNDFAKIFPQSSEIKAIKVWGDGDELWVIWQHNFSTPVTDELLIQLSTYKMEVKIWDAKEKCSSKARYDRTKSIKQQYYKDGRNEHQYGVEGALMRLSKYYEKKIPTRMWLNRPLPHESHAYRTDQQRSQQTLRTDSRKLASRTTRSRKSRSSKQKEDFSLYAVPRHDTSSKALSYARLQKLAGPGTPDPDDFKVARKQSSVQGKLPTGAGASNTLAAEPLKEEDENTVAQESTCMAQGSTLDFEKGSEGGTTREDQVKRSKRHQNPDWEKNGQAKITINMAGLFDTENIIERLNDPVENVEDGFVMVSISEPLLSAEQKQTLNPLTIRVRSIQQLPFEPYGQDYLREKCENVYCQYQFFNQSLHKTAGRPHGEKVVWDDIQVILTGTFNAVELSEYFHGPGLLMEIHDRDRKPETEKLKPALFGDDLEDEKISNVGLVTAKRTIYKTFSDQVKPWDPYGVAKVDLLGIMYGQKLIEVEVPVQKCHLPDPLGKTPDKDHKVMGIAGAIDGPTQGPLETGDYIEAGTTLKVTLKMAKAFNYQKKAAKFGRMVVEFGYKNISRLHNLQTAVKHINATAFNLNHLPSHAISTVLTTRKLNKTDAASDTFDAVSGFHVSDGLRHVFVLEGLRDLAMKTLWDIVQPQEPEEQIRVLYNYELTHNARLFANMELDFPCIRLHEPLENILEQSMFYVRDVVPRASFHGLTKLHNLIKSENLQAAVRGEHFPTEEMLHSITQQFSIPMTIDEMITMETPDNQAERPYSYKSSNTSVSSSKRQQDRVDSFNEEGYKALLVKRSKSNIDFIQENLKSVHIKSAAVRAHRAKSSPVKKVTAGDTPAHNYSMQRLNSSELANAKIRQMMDPKKKYTYMIDYHAAGTVPPVDIVQKLKEAEEESKAKWQTPVGWTYPGYKTALQSNQNPKKLPEPNKDELDEEWQENKLHAAVLQPTVPGREAYAWEKRDEDMDVWSRPTGEFKKDPYSIFPAGDTKAADEHNKLRREYENWLQGVVVEDMRFRTHRVLPESELKAEGLKASNQLDRLKGILKDPANKLGFIFPGSRGIPALGVHKAPPSAPTDHSYMPGDVGGSLFTDYLVRKEHGRGFKLICDDKSMVYRRKTAPMTASEKRNNLFRTAQGFMNLPKMTETIKGQEKAELVSA